ncbi:MAG: Phenoxybenzoate dioxygenase subunit beta [Paracidovorax wautersii]|uniref:Phenoxybenzoate dioxygenase subunit beta n=1 Tax=Paracidovorax wautersii TaxID=1177982 RepID=A0A7V8JQ47_9BURK|nr:MAG: Phenoxybenzoate dioxygenase subunit beta [Paracidovorax wautersii]
MIVNTSFQDAVVVGLRDVTPTVREIRLRPLEGAARAHEPGAHLQVRIAPESPGGAALARHYSLVGEPDGQDWRIAVKQQPDGRGGSRAMWRLAVGERLSVSEPQNHFALDLRAPAYLLVAGGIGVTPLVMMAERLARRGLPVRMVYAARGANELAFADELRGVLGDRLATFASDAGQRIDLAAEIAALAPGGQLYTCGPVPMLEAIKSAWQAAGRLLADLRFETFGSGGSLAAQTFKVKVPRQGKEIVVPVGASLLEALELAGVETLSDCRRGECGLCAMDVIGVDGSIDHRDVFLSDEEKHANTRICACVSRAVGTLMLDSAYRPDTLEAAG